MASQATNDNMRPPDDQMDVPLTSSIVANVYPSLNDDTAETEMDTPISIYPLDNDNYIPPGEH